MTVYLLAYALEIPAEVIIAEVTAQNPDLKKTNDYLGAPKLKGGRPRQ